MLKNVRKFCFHETKVGVLSLSVDGINIYSRYNPCKEVCTFWDNNKFSYENKNEIVIYGLGLGYHILELRKRVSEEIKIYIFDFDDELIENIKREGILEDIEGKSTFLHIGNTYENIKLFSHILSKSKNLIIIDSLFKVLPNKHSDLKKVLINYRIKVNSLFIFKDKMEECFKINTSKNYNSIDKFIKSNQKSFKPIAIVASGPSLDDKVFELLSKNRDKIRIFCVGRSLKALLNNGIIPDLTCVIDCQDYVYDHLCNIKEQIPLAFLSTANSKSIECLSGEKYIFYNDRDIHGTIIQTGGSVAISTIDIATYCNTSRIFMFGQDLAYTNGFSHSKYSLYKYDNYEVEEKSSESVLSVNGEYIQTNKVYKMFKYEIEKIIERNKHIKFYNLSSGANIGGSKYIAISEFENNI
ncbi:MAG: 6-hydroxymethylpterin diphosphokinase MptE-like protein [Clostridium sp.]